MISCFTTSFHDLERPFLNQNILSCFRTSVFCFGTSFSCFRTSFFCFLTSFSCFLCSFGKVILSRDVPGQRSLSRDKSRSPCPGTKGHRDMKISLSRDKGTTVQTVRRKERRYSGILQNFQKYLLRGDGGFFSSFGLLAFICASILLRSFRTALLTILVTYKFVW